MRGAFALSGRQVPALARARRVARREACEEAQAVLARRQCHLSLAVPAILGRCYHKRRAEEERREEGRVRGLPVYMLIGLLVFSVKHGHLP